MSPAPDQVAPDLTDGERGIASVNKRRPVKLGSAIVLIVIVAVVLAIAWLFPGAGSKQATRTDDPRAASNKRTDSGVPTAKLIPDPPPPSQVDAPNPFAPPRPPEPTPPDLSALAAALKIVPPTVVPVVAPPPPPPPPPRMRILTDQREINEAVHVLDGNGVLMDSGMGFVRRRGGSITALNTPITEADTRPRAR